MLFNAQDELVLLAAAGLEVRLSADRAQLIVEGPEVVLDAAEPTLKQHRAALVAELQARAAANASGDVRRSP